MSDAIKNRSQTPNNPALPAWLATQPAAGGGKATAAAQAAAAGQAPGDGVDAASAQAPGAAGSHPSAPPLPDVAGPVAHADMPREAKGWDSAERPMSLSQALNLLTDLGSRTQQQRGESAAEMSKLSANAAFSSAAAKKKEVEGERKHSVNALVGSAVAFAAVGLMSYFGGARQVSSDSSKAASGAFLSATGNASSQLINNFVDCIDQNAKTGGSYQAGQAKIQGAIHDAMGQVYQGLGQNFNQSYQAWQKGVQDLLALKAAIRDSKNQTNINLAQNA